MNMFVCVLNVAFLLATQLNDLTEDNLVPNSVFLVKKSINNTLTDGRYVFSFAFPP